MMIKKKKMKMKKKEHSESEDDDNEEEEREDDDDDDEEEEEEGEDLSMLSFAVTAIDANHCLGAVMYLFEGYFGRVLCTGDCRYQRGMFDGYNVVDVDRLYLDDTYANTAYYDFLTSDECVDVIMSILRKPENRDKRVMMALDTLGKEELLISMSEKLKTLIVVTKERFEQLKVLFSTQDINMCKYFTCDERQGYIHVGTKRDVSLSNLDRVNLECQQNAIRYNLKSPMHMHMHMDMDMHMHMHMNTNINTNMDMDMDMMYSNDHAGFIGIICTGWAAGQKMKKEEPICSRTDHSRIYKVCYSLHSSFSELCQLVEFVKPRQIIPITNGHFTSRVFTHFKQKRKLHQMNEESRCIRFATAPKLKTHTYASSSSLSCHPQKEVIELLHSESEDDQAFKTEHKKKKRKIVDVSDTSFSALSSDEESFIDSLLNQIRERAREEKKKKKKKELFASSLICMSFTQNCKRIIKNKTKKKTTMLSSLSHHLNINTKNSFIFLFFALSCFCFNFNPGHVTSHPKAAQKFVFSFLRK
ncbi:hypothetical protein RFI_04557 [Reticulomyxa filosa]|uniref:Protein artemis n=1 Tax=Reticulomyxa filosa TaxID=46433 RepID=X6P358_RETFI|nr:hypothetical protein RFI_04557 [Reticulomyxa filosa]|eukprot:ETO32563.1 hypothetical protein RFI_04557 [Reticulomyxa filosa]